MTAWLRERFEKQLAQIGPEGNRCTWRGRSPVEEFNSLGCREIRQLLEARLLLAAEPAGEPKGERGLAPQERKPICGTAFAGKQQIGQVKGGGVAEREPEGISGPGKRGEMVHRRSLPWGPKKTVRPAEGSDCFHWASRPFRPRSRAQGALAEFERN